MTTTTQEGRWHDTLNQLRVQLRRGMDGETSASQRKMGLDYGINFGVNLLRLREMAKALPKEEELADLMWQKDVREMRLLSIMIRPLDQLTLTKASELAHEADTLEVAEQLVFLLFRRAPFAAELMRQLFRDRLEPSSIPALTPYLLLNHLSREEEQLTPTLFEEVKAYIVEDFKAPSFADLTVIYHALLKVVTERSDLDVKTLLDEVSRAGTEATRSLATQLQEIAKEA